jgi:sirohydrochlorin cobaltochelatase
LRLENMTRTAFILIAHGAREPAWAAPPRRVRDLVAAHAPELRVELAFTERMSPNLVECAEKLATEGFERILALPLFIARGGHLTRDVPRQLDELRRKHPRVIFELTPPVGEAEAVVQAMACHVLDMAR